MTNWRFAVTAASGRGDDAQLPDIPLVPSVASRPSRCARSRALARALVPPSAYSSICDPALEFRTARLPVGFGGSSRMSSLHCMPMIIINMGGEMVYILAQRLQAQSVPIDKSKRGEQAFLRHPQRLYEEASACLLLSSARPSACAHAPLLRLESTAQFCRTSSARCTTQSSSRSSSGHRTYTRCRRCGRSSTGWHTRRSCA